MDRSLSALLPVRNVESTLRGSLLEMLEILPELTSRFELVVIDDCSTDATIEVADELIACYPQLRAIRHCRPIGRTAAIRTGLMASTGRIVFIGDATCGLAISEVRRMWQAMREHHLVLGYPRDSREGIAASASATISANSTGFQMGRREVVESLAAELSDQADLRARLSRYGHHWHELELRDRAPPLAPHRVAIQARQIYASPSPSTDVEANSDLPPAVASKPKQPNYLARQRNLVGGE